MRTWWWRSAAATEQKDPTAFWLEVRWTGATEPYGPRGVYSHRRELLRGKKKVDGGPQALYRYVQVDTGAEAAAMQAMKEGNYCRSWTQLSKLWILKNVEL